MKLALSTFLLCAARGEGVRPDGRALLPADTPWPDSGGAAIPRRWRTEAIPFSIFSQPSAHRALLGRRKTRSPAGAQTMWTPFYFGNPGTGKVHRLNRLLVGPAALGSSDDPMSPGLVGDRDSAIRPSTHKNWSTS